MHGGKPDTVALPGTPPARPRTTEDRATAQAETALEIRLYPSFPMATRGGSGRIGRRTELRRAFRDAAPTRGTHDAFSDDVGTRSGVAGTFCPGRLAKSAVRAPKRGAHAPKSVKRRARPKKRRSRPKKGHVRPSPPPVRRKKRQRWRKKRRHRHFFRQHRHPERRGRRFLARAPPQALRPPLFSPSSPLAGATLPRFGASGAWKAARVAFGVAHGPANQTAAAPVSDAGRQAAPGVRP